MIAMKTDAPQSFPGLGAELVQRGGRPKAKRLAINDPRHPGLHAAAKAELSQYAREEMRLSGGIRVSDPAEEQRLEPWQTRNRWIGSVRG